MKQMDIFTFTFNVQKEGSLQTTICQMMLINLNLPLENFSMWVLSTL
jgi:hypothetical protein